MFKNFVRDVKLNLYFIWLNLFGRLKEAQVRQDTQGVQDAQGVQDTHVGDADDRLRMSRNYWRKKYANERKARIKALKQIDELHDSYNELIAVIYHDWEDFE